MWVVISSEHRWLCQNITNTDNKAQIVRGKSSGSPGDPEITEECEIDEETATVQGTRAMNHTKIKSKTKKSTLLGFLNTIRANVM